MIDTGTKRRWTWAISGAVVVLAGVLMMFRAPRVSHSGAPTAGVKVGLAKPGLDSALQDEATFYDPMPLFLPTKLNAAPKPFELREPGAAFRDFQPKLGFADVDLKLNALSLPKPVQVPPNPADKPGDVLALPVPGPLMLGFGRSGAPVAPVRARGAFVEISAAGTGRRVLVQALAETARPPSGARWEPMEFLAAVDAAGLVGSLVLTVRSGAEEVDNYFQNYLARTLRVGERLAPGYYRICVGP